MLSADFTPEHGRYDVMGLFCPRSSPCTDAKQIAFSGFVLQPLEGGNIPDIEEEIYRNVESKSSWTAVAFMLVTAALTWGVGAAMAGSASWGVVDGAIAATTSTGGGAAIAGELIAAGAGAGYAGVNALANGGPVTSMQGNWLGAMNTVPSAVSYGTSDGSTCNSVHCSNLYANASSRHIQTGSPGTHQAGGNLQGTTQLLQGNCPVYLTAAQCTAQGMNPGQAPRTDSHPNRAFNTEVYERKRQSCVNAGYGANQQTLYKCLAASVVIDDSSGEQ